MLFSLGEVEKEIADLRRGLNNLKKELEVQKTANHSDRRDQFVPVMTDFATVATLGFTEINDALATAKKKVRASGLIEWSGQTKNNNCSTLILQGHAGLLCSAAGRNGCWVLCGTFPPLFRGCNYCNGKCAHYFGSYYAGAVRS